MELIKFSIMVILLIAILHCIYDTLSYSKNIANIKRNIRTPRRQLTPDNVKLDI